MHKGGGEGQKGSQGESGRYKGREVSFDSIPPLSFLGRPERCASLLQNKERIHVWLLTTDPGRIEWSLTIQLAAMHMNIGVHADWLTCGRSQSVRERRRLREPNNLEAGATMLICTLVDQ